MDRYLADCLLALSVPFKSDQNNQMQRERSEMQQTAEVWGRRHRYGANVLVNSDTGNVNDARDALLDESQPESHKHNMFRISVPWSLLKAAC